MVSATPHATHSVDSTTLHVPQPKLRLLQPKLRRGCSWALGEQFVAHFLRRLRLHAWSHTECLL